MTDSFRRVKNPHSTIANFLLTGGGAALIYLGQPWHVVIIYFAISVCAVVLIEIKAKLKAIRFMLAHEFDERNGLSE